MQTEVVDNKQEANPQQGNGNKVAKLAGVNLELALESDLVVVLPRSKTTCRGIITGFHPYEYIMAGIRLPKSFISSMGYKEEIVIKYLLEGTVYGFKSNILNYITRPAPLLFFTYPDSMEKLDLRKSSRIDCNMEGMIFTMDDGKGRDCLVLNVSETGCQVAVRIKSRDPLSKVEAGSDMVLAMQLGTKTHLKLPVSIKNVTREKGTIRLGCMFLDIKETEQEQLAEYVERIERLRT